MKLNNFFKHLILTINISLIMTACSSFYNHKITAIDDTQNIESSPVNNINTKNNQILDELIPLKTRELETRNIIYFALDQYDIPTQFFYTLNAHADFLYNNPLYHVKIEGHTDERGTPEYNIALGERRANSVKSYLQSKGVLSEQICTVSYGKEKPAVFGHNEEAYYKNRRVVLIYK